MEEYSKKDSTFIAGCAIIMMFYYHFFAFPEFLPKPDCYYAPIKYLGVLVQELFAHFGQLCVAIFAFNSGYVLYKKREDFNRITMNAKRAANFLDFILGCVFAVYLRWFGFQFKVTGHNRNDAESCWIECLCEG